METLPSDNPGDCQAVAVAVAVAADSTTAALGVLSTLAQRAAAGGHGVNSAAELLQHVSSTTVTPTLPPGTSPPTSTAVNPSNNNNGGKAKPQQQAQQNPIAVKFHQFRAPQQFVKHKKPTSMLAKKNKTWNKRQNKCHLNKQHQLLLQQGGACASLAGPGSAAGGVAGSHGPGAVGGALPATKADLENIQNLKNQLGGGGGGGGHHAYYHHHGGHGRAGGGTGNANGLAPCLCSLDKLGYGHGHLKQSQLHKKMLVHRGHHHHVLCAGAAHNAIGGASASCCLANGCSAPNGKGDPASGNGHSSSGGAAATQTLHYCCGRSKFFLPDKRPRKEVIIPPTKFLLGGNISDPLNLTSLQNEAANASSSSNNTPATTPRQSPITTPPKVEVIIPPNIHDPLHLLDPVDSMEYEKQLTSPMKRKSKSNKSKNRHRKNRKPKRRRYESYNSTSMDDDAISLAGSGGGGGGGSSALANSTISTEGANSTMSMSMSLVSVENASAVCAEAYDEGELDESRHSPALATGELLLSAATTAVERVEKSTTALSPNGPQQHVAGASGEAPATAGDMLQVRRSSERERVSKDLRLELSMCGVGVANHSHNNSASSSTCGSVGGGGGGVGVGIGGGRKRKISESSNSQKNKKFHRLDSMDKIVSPVVPQPGAWKRPPRLVPTGARKASRRSTSISETELLSPADDAAKTLNDTESNRGDTPDLNKMESASEAGVGSPLSTNSGATSVAAGEQDSMAEVSLGEAATAPAAATEGVVAPAAAAAAAGPANAVAPLTKAPKFRADGAKYMYGNYDRYAGFRHLNEFMDVRLQVFQRHLELFQNKDILDIGCNVGHMTITVARNLAPKSILGIDIDKDLIARARRNLSMHVRIPPDAKPKAEATAETKPGPAVGSAGAKKLKKSRRQRQKKHQQQPANAAPHSHSHHHHHHHLLLHHHQHQHLLQQQQANKLHVDASELFPVAFPLSYGSIPDLASGTAADTATPLTSGSTPGHAGGGSKSKNDFPRNVFFRQTNYVLKDESQLNNDSQQYDLIMCLSVTKWIHLNFGDNGLKLAFKRMFNQLRPGGKLILEAQNWASYKKKKNLTEQIYNNYRSIEFFPNKFHEYLLSSEVGFSHSCTLGVPRHMNKGFCRPIQLYAKGDYTPNHVRWSDAYYPQTPYEAYRGIYATMPPRPAGSSAGIAYPMMSSSRSQNYDTPHHPGLGGGGGGGGSGSGSYSCRQTPMHQPTSQYYNPLETDSYLPSYDMEYLNHLYVFASPLYQTVWSPPASLRNSSSHTPLFGSVREAELDGDGSSGGAGGGSYHRHVYPPNEDTSSPNASTGGAFNSIRDPDTDDSNQLPASSVQHVYATNCESSSSPQVHHHDSEPLDDALILADVADEGVAAAANSGGDDA